MAEAERLTAQVSYLISLSDQLLAVWQELGGDYGLWDESRIHSILHQKGRSSALRTKWQEYPRAEAQVCISFMRYHLLNNYNAMLTKRRDDSRAAWRKEKEIKETCLIWSDMNEAALRDHPMRLAPEVFEFVAVYGGSNYYRLRETKIELYIERKARDMWRAHRYDETDHVFPAPLFEAVKIEGFTGVFYKPLFERA